MVNNVFTLCTFEEDPGSLQIAAEDVPSTDSMAGCIASPV